MTVAKDKVVAIEYTVIDDEKQVIDSSEGGDPLEYLHGDNNIIPGLEKALEGKKAEDTLSITIKPEDAYGEYYAELVVQVERDRFQSSGDIEIGMQFEAESEDGSRLVTVTAIDDKMITVDANHSLAGKTLHFDVRIVSVRDATEDELKEGLSGHSCGCGGACGDDCDCDNDCEEDDECCGSGGCSCH